MSRLDKTFYITVTTLALAFLSAWVVFAWKMVLQW